MKSRSREPRLPQLPPSLPHRLQELRSRLLAAEAAAAADGEGAEAEAAAAAAVAAAAELADAEDAAYWEWHLQLCRAGGGTEFQPLPDI
ncbi:hypothetical protein BOX15_Mlig030557g2 [Macrostomum lignano]|uniref:Uncharacterized protein n=2 Tax=Macrostomum lignano TaxID=282301 RepID=A0A267EY62_9PLAT|nr:hypothetical protein BOX15_Mlig030557g2 [Macrostomum lignano]